ncbi:diaminopimelate epimerase [Bdellovibrio sp. HCB337]|uniref:diaminopimelate epimerase n=1 Tax=Bdellovibrio sp. HCB337 TaxID=3394358 RepID=UPI0039A68813
MAFLPIPLVKMSGAGNTFVLVDATKTSSWLEIESKLRIKRRPFVKMICDRTLGVAADGVLFLAEGQSEAEYSWDFYNADGSNADMCGNAARCAALFANEYLSSSVSGSYKFNTGAGLVSAQVLGDDRVRVLMPEVKAYQEFRTLEIDGKPQTFSYVNSGVPHLVMQISNYKEAPELKEMARKARHHKDILPEGANVTFYVKEKDGLIKAVTFERGVEDYTQACGTGAVAAAYVEFKKTQTRNIDVHMPGGILAVQFNESTKNPLMTGEAVFVMEFQYFYEVVG